MPRRLRRLHNRGMFHLQQFIGTSKNWMTSKKSRNIHFQSSPRQLVAHILKKQSEKCFHTNEMTLQALKLDNQPIDKGIPRTHSTLNHLVKHSLVEKKL